MSRVEPKQLAAGLYKHSLHKPDGRELFLYQADAAPVETLPQSEERELPSPHLRYHALRGEWVMVNAKRQGRTFLPPAEYCPLCASKPGEVPTEIPYENFDIAVFENRWPSMAMHAELPETSGPSAVAAGRGVCEVIVYDAEHKATISSLSDDKLRRLVGAWRDRSEDLSQRQGINYVLIFENRGEEVGVTLHHPHGQIYAYPFFPPYIKMELEQTHQHGDILGDTLAYEEADGARTVFSSEHWLVLVPFWARYPYECYVLPRRYTPNLVALNDAEQADLAQILGRLSRAYDALFGQTMPYVMAIQQAPNAGDIWRHYRMRIEFQPRLRAANKLKYLAGTEVAAGAFAVDALAEDYAKTLRDVMRGL